MVEKKQKLIARKAKQAGDLANKAGQGVAQVWQDLNSKGKEGLHRAYLSKRPYAVEKVLEIKSEFPGITPREAQEVLDAELSRVEAKKGTLSVAFTGAASMYFITSMELRQMDPKSADTTKALFSLLLILDSRVVKGIRYIAKFVAFVLPYLKEARAAKAGGAVLNGAKKAKMSSQAIKGAKATAKAKAAKKAVKLVKEHALPAAKEQVKNAVNSGRATSYIIDQTHKIIGPAPSRWKTEDSKPKSTKKAK
jgi:hypothetical protein